MKNIRKSFLAVLALTSCLSVSACGGSEPAPADPTPIEPAFVGTTLPDLIEVKPGEKDFEGITVNYNKIVLFNGETAQIEVECYPVRPTKPAYKFVSSNTNLVTVDANGLVTAGMPYQDASGKNVYTASISVKTPDDKVEKVIPVSVYTKNMQSNKINSLVSKIKTAQGKVEAPSKVKLEETIYEMNYRDGALTSYLKENQSLTFSIKDAYFQLQAVDVQAKVEGGTIGTSSIKYTFYTNESYDTWVFREQGNVKNCMRVSTTSYIGVENGRYKALVAVLDNFFTNGSGIMTKQVDAVLGVDSDGKSMLNYASSSKNISSFGDDQITFDVVENDVGISSNARYEENLGIPAECAFDFNYFARYEFLENFLASQSESREFIWNYKNSEYSMVEKVEANYITSNFELDYPNRDSFAIVDDIYSL